MPRLLLLRAPIGPGNTNRYGAVDLDLKSLWSCPDGERRSFLRCSGDFQDNNAYHHINPIRRVPVLVFSAHENGGHVRFRQLRTLGHAARNLPTE
jgi:hypothetical protein